MTRLLNEDITRPLDAPPGWRHVCESLVASYDAPDSMGSV